MFKKMMLLVLCLIAASFCYAQSSDQSGDQDQPQVADQPTTDQPTMVDQNTDQPAPDKMISGKISDIDHKKMEITIKDETTKNKQKFTFSTDTAFTRDGATITHDELKKGQLVTIEVNDQNMVTKIDVTPKESKESKESKTEEKKDSEQPH